MSSLCGPQANGSSSTSELPSACEVTQGASVPRIFNASAVLSLIDLFI